ncbi:hypothetical protein ASE86_11000 [Sphingomonas sp. Leaf33]|uniref:hypothetical protein n=1 Tax=Sphingomonas sp. Leaf33 TaxID=1736215 RepID=UPI0006F2D1D6|nr:hypothetical protein [Sphingomonas sp. Leaf33]KQN26599.1 hypothetical protein ASE86_11000 [Sphingomonas sp. Leaf33]
MAGQAGRLILAAALSPLLLAAGPAAPDPVRALAGRYSQHFQNGTVDGDTYWSDDVVEIVPVDARHAYVRIETNFFNGHSCSLSGVAAAERASIIYREPASGVTGGACVMTLRRRGAKLSFTDNNGGCQSYCGARGGFAGGELPWSSRRPIRYMARLKSSDTYRAALTEWRTGKAR